MGLANLQIIQGLSNALRFDQGNHSHGHLSKVGGEIGGDQATRWALLQQRLDNACG
jgi:hypothetical protein